MKRVLVSAIAGVSVLGVGGIALAQTLQYRAHPVGDFEVPDAIDTEAEGSLKLKVSSDGTEVRYDLKITEPIDDAFMAHLHMAPAGENGPIVVWLYPHDGPPGLPIPGSFEGRLAKDVITEDDLIGPLAGDWEGFLEAIEDGNLYVNVHTDLHKGGEIRDQVHSHPD